MITQEWAERDFALAEQPHRTQQAGKVPRGQLTLAVEATRLSLLPPTPTIRCDTTTGRALRVTLHPNPCCALIVQ